MDSDMLGCLLEKLEASLVILFELCSGMLPTKEAVWAKMQMTRTGREDICDSMMYLVSLVELAELLWK